MAAREIGLDLKVLHFYKTSLPDSMGGVEQVIHQIARGTSRHGVSVDVLALAPGRTPATIEMDGYTVYRSRQDFQLASTGFSSSVFREFARLARQADIIHYHYPWPLMDLVHFFACTGKPAIVTYHSEIIRQKLLLQLYRPLKRRFLKDVNHIVATSPNYLATSNVLKRFADKVSVIPIGLERNDYPEPDQHLLAKWRARLGSRFFLFIGVLRYYKGLHVLIRAAQGVDYPIVIVGAGPVEAELKALVNKLALKNVHFLGYLPNEDKAALLTLCHSVVFPSYLRSEAFGISLLEGAMFGKPLISCEIGTGTTYINVDGETGIVVPPSDPESLRRAMQVLWNNQTLAETMGKQAEQRYRNHFTAEKMIKAYLALYTQCCSGSVL